MRQFKVGDGNVPKSNKKKRRKGAPDFPAKKRGKQKDTPEMIARRSRFRAIIARTTAARAAITAQIGNTVLPPAIAQLPVMIGRPRVPGLRGVRGPREVNIEDGPFEPPPRPPIAPPVWFDRNEISIIDAEDRANRKAAKVAAAISRAAMVMATTRARERSLPSAPISEDRMKVRRSIANKAYREPTSKALAPVLPTARKPKRCSECGTIGHNIRGCDHSKCDPLMCSLVPRMIIEDAVGAVLAEHAPTDAEGVVPAEEQTPPTRRSRIRTGIVATGVP